VDQLHLPGVFSAAPVATALVFECIRDPADADVRVGDVVRVIDMRDKIEAFKGVNGVGYVVAVDSFRSLVVLSETNGMAVDASVVEVSDLSPTFTIKVHQQ
jgi:hypothetical protein